MCPDQNKVRKKSAQRNNSWSIMLVGDNGRIIPFRRFKGMLIAAMAFMLIIIAVAVVLGVLYAAQAGKINGLTADLADVRDQAVKLRDENHLLKTQLEYQKLLNKSPKKEAKKAPVPPAPEKKIAEAEKAPPAPAKPVEKLAPKIERPKAAAPKPIELGAEARRFKVTYQPNQQVLKAVFRIYNTSKPKKRLAGRIVVVFKNPDDPPIKWVTVPRVQLIDGMPSGQRGQTFQINNYRTVEFKAFRQKAPVRLNTASVYVFSKDGDMIYSKDFGFNIAYRPPAKPKSTPPAAPAKKPVAPPPADTTAVKNEVQSTNRQQSPVEKKTHQAPVPDESRDVTAPEPGTGPQAPEPALQDKPSPVEDHTPQAAPEAPVDKQAEQQGPETTSEQTPPTPPGQTKPPTEGDQQ